MLTKTVKLLLIVCFSILALVGFVNVISFFVESKKDAHQSHGIVIQDTTQSGLQNAQKGRKQISNIQYSFPIKLYGSSYSFFKVLLVEPEVSELFKRMGSYSMNSEYDNGIIVNFVFLNPKTQNLNLLFNKPSFIQTYSAPSSRVDSGQTKILYNAIIRDSNLDGIISSEDNVVLFFSGLDGSDLTQITPDSLSLTRWQFAENFQSVIIEVKQPIKDKSVDEKLWPRHLSWYDLNTKKFKYQQLEVLLERSKHILGK
jgi:hypothetical protein